jgi:hypothetical protein
MRGRLWAQVFGFSIIASLRKEERVDRRELAVTLFFTMAVAHGANASDWLQWRGPFRH